MGITEASLATGAGSGRLLPGDDPGADRGRIEGKRDNLVGLEENIIIG